MAGPAPYGFKVHYRALRHYAEIIAVQGRRLQEINAALSHVDVPAGAFGKLPESGNLRGEYEAHARAEITNTADLPGLLEGVAEALEATADHYAATESAITQTVYTTGSGGG